MISLSFVKTLLKKPKVILVSVATVAVIATTTFVCYKVFAAEPERIYVEESKVNEDSRVIVRNIVAAEAKERGLILGYENPSYSYDFKRDDSPKLLQENPDDGFVKRNLRKVGRGFAGKHYSVTLDSHIKIGFDYSSVLIEEVSDNELMVVVPNLEVAFIPLFEENTDFDSFIGLFRSVYSENDRKEIIGEAIDKGHQVIADDPEILDKGFELSCNAFEEFIRSIPALEGKDITLDFKLIDNKPVFTEDVNFEE